MFSCGHVFKKSVRMVIQLDGRLEHKVGSTTKRKPPKDDTYHYRSAIYAGVHSGLTVGQVYGVACGKKNGPIVRSDCKIWIPEKTQAAWHKLARDVYPWALAPRKPKASA